MAQFIELIDSITSRHPYGDLFRRWFTSAMPETDTFLGVFLNEQPMTINGAHHRTYCGEVVRCGLRPL